MKRFKEEDIEGQVCIELQVAGFHKALFHTRKGTASFTSRIIPD
jgi:hypothetical protein